MILVGLTGSIGMGKSTTARLFAEAGARVWDADAAVHRLYAVDGPAVAPICQVFGPEVLSAAGAVDRRRLSQLVTADPRALRQLEQIVHPLVAQDRQGAIETARAEGAAVMVLDIPLLFETGAQATVDVVVVVTAPAEVQRERVLARPGMTPEKLDAILSRQLPDAEKRRRADYLVETSQGLVSARAQVQAIMEKLLPEKLAQR